MSGCVWTSDDPDDVASSLLRKALGHGPHLPGIQGYRALMDALDKDSKLRDNVAVKTRIAETLFEDRRALMDPCVAVAVRGGAVSMPHPPVIYAGL
jgi:hypothetical protein